MAENSWQERAINDMGPDLGPVLIELWKEVALLHAKWNQYRQLYAHSRERLDFLNKVAGDFVGIIQDPLLDDVLLHLTQLTDPPKSFGKFENLTLRALPERVPERALANELNGLVQAAQKACEPAWSSRNKRIAHRDLALALAGTFDNSPSPADIEAALRAVRAVLDRLDAHYWKSEGETQYFFPEGRDANSLVRYLLKGFRADEPRMERFHQGNPLPEDLEPEDEI